MDREPLRVRCACGWELAGEEDDVVAGTQEHGRRVHNMTATRDDVLAMALPSPDEDTERQVGRR
jgi:hypothetical protein